MRSSLERWRSSRLSTSAESLVNLQIKILVLARDLFVQ